MAYGYKVVFNENKVKVMVEDKEAADVVRWILDVYKRQVYAWTPIGESRLVLIDRRII